MLSLLDTLFVIMQQLDRGRQTTYHPSHMTAYGNYRNGSEKTAYEEASRRQVQEKKEKRAKQLQQVRERRKIIAQFARPHRFNISYTSLLLYLPTYPPAQSDTILRNQNRKKRVRENKYVFYIVFIMNIIHNR